MEEWWRRKCKNFQIIYFLFIHGLFNDTVSSSEYTVSSGKILCKHRIVKEVGSRVDEELARLCVERLRKTMIHIGSKILAVQI